MFITVKSRNPKYLYTEKAKSYLHQTTAFPIQKVVKKNGTYKVKVKMKGKYKGSGSAKFTIIPPATQITTLTANTGNIALKWKKIKKAFKKQVSGYVIQYAFNKRFTSGKKAIVVKGPASVKKTLSKLSDGKAYFIRIRSFKTVKGKKYFSKWSKIKSISTKKIPPTPDPTPQEAETPSQETQENASEIPQN